MQYTIRLLLPEGSLLLDHADGVPSSARGTPARRTYEWTPADPTMDVLQAPLLDLGQGERGAGRHHYRDLCDSPQLAIGLRPVDLSQKITDIACGLLKAGVCCN